MSFGECLFLQGVIRKEPKEAHMSGLHRDKTPTYEKEASRRVGKANPPEGRAHLSEGRAPALGRSQSRLSSYIMPPPPLKINLIPLIKVGLIRRLMFLKKGYISKAPWPRRNGEFIH
jgi:hypothetical protein